MSGPLGFAFAVHIHQPVGNFDHVFRDHVDGVYRPFLEATAARDLRPLTLHVSGPLLDWLERHDPALVDAIGREVADGRIELLGSGWSEPVLAALSRRDRVEQVEWMRAALHRRFGVAPTGLWLTERVWEQDLTVDLAAAGVEYTLLDDRHFLATGIDRDALDRPYRTESGGHGLGLLAIDERLRYLIPFEPVEQIERELRDRHARGAGLAVLGDDGEKFGGWPGTRDWVYRDGWLDRFLDLVDRLRHEEVLELLTTGEAAGRESGGLAYPAPGSYREMEGWSLPRPAALELEGLRGRLGVSQAAGDEAAENEDEAHAALREGHPAVRGGHWRQFLTRYPVSGRMHRHAAALSDLCRFRGDPADARTAVFRAQCNDAYWHGVFGGVYLPHLRQAVWRELAAAEADLREGQALRLEVLDLDLDGHDELWVHGARISAVVSPRRGGTIESFLRLESGTNDVDVLGRHFEAYHGDPDTAPSWAEVRAAWLADRTDGAATEAGEGTPSIHDLAPAERPAPPGIDRFAPALFRERLLLRNADRGVESPTFRVVSAKSDGETARIELDAATPGITLRKRFLFRADGGLGLELEWNPSELAADSTVSTRSIFGHPRDLTADGPVEVHRHDIVTLARSELGYEEILQGEEVRLDWPASEGAANVDLAPDDPEV